MATIQYTPIGHGGFRCQLASDSGSTLTVERTELEDDIDVAGDARFKRNESLVQTLSGCAQQEFLSRRARSDEKTKSHRAQADRYEAECTEIAEMIGRLGVEGQEGWCSACFSRSAHRRVSGVTRPKAYLCQNCGSVTTICAIRGCDDFATRSSKSTTVANYCAAHRHEINGFEKLDEQLESIDDYEQWLEFDKRNVPKITKRAVGVLGGALLVTPAAFASAGAIGGAIGSWAGLSGAAAKSYGLALLGGGSVASGGLGMIGGTAVVTAAGTGLGSALGGAITSAYVKDDSSFKIELVDDGSGTPVVFVQGFLTEDKTDAADTVEWVSTIRARYPDAPIYRVHWGSKELKSLGVLVGKGLGEAGVKHVAVKLAGKATKAGAKQLSVFGKVLGARDLIANPWTVAHQRAGMTGAVLADIIARTKEQRFVLVGHSLGARVVVTAAEALATMPRADRRIESMHLLGAAVGTKGDWQYLNDAVDEKVWNYWSKNDAVLKWLYRTGQRGQRAVGHVGFGSTFANISDRNVSQQVDSHSAYIAKVRLR